MSLPAKKTAVLHVARKELGLTEDEYRSILEGVAGVHSSRDLDDAGFEAVMLRFRDLGFESPWLARNFGYRSDMASPKQVALIRHLWAEYTDGAGTDRSLDKWIRGRFKTAALRFVGRTQATKVIGGLRAMIEKKGAR